VPLQASRQASAAAPEEPAASKPAPAGNAPLPLWQNAQASAKPRVYPYNA